MVVFLLLWSRLFFIEMKVREVSIFVLKQISDMKVIRTVVGIQHEPVVENI